MESVVVRPGGLGHAVYPVLDSGDLPVDVIHGGLSLVPQSVGVGLQQVPNLAGQLAHLVQIALSSRGNPVPSFIESSESLIEGLLGPVYVVAGVIHPSGGVVVDIRPLFEQLGGQTGNLFHSIGNGGKMTVQIHGGEGDLEGIGVLSISHILCHCGHILLQGVQLLREGQMVGRD